MNEQQHSSGIVERTLVRGREAAAMLGVSRAHFYRMHKAGRVPLPVKLGGAVRWRIEELRAWIAAGMPNRQRWEAMHASAAAACAKGGER